MRTWALSQWWLGMVGLITIAVLTGMSHGGVPVRPYRVAVLTTGAITLPIMDGLREGLAQLGYAEGTALTFVVEDTHGTVVQLDRHLARLIAAHPDVIMTIGTAPTVAAKQATTTIPIVFTLMNSKSLRPTNCAAFIRLSTSHTSSAANLPGGSSAMQGFSRGAEPDPMDNAPRLPDHSIFWSILGWGYGHDAPEHGSLVNPRQPRGELLHRCD